MTKHINLSTSAGQLAAKLHGLALMHSNLVGGCFDACACIGNLAIQRHGLLAHPNTLCLQRFGACLCDVRALPLGGNIQFQLGNFGVVQRTHARTQHLQVWLSNRRLHGLPLAASSSVERALCHPTFASTRDMFCTGATCARRATKFTTRTAQLTVMVWTGFLTISRHESGLITNCIVFVNKTSLYDVIPKFKLLCNGGYNQPMSHGNRFAACVV